MLSNTNAAPKGLALPLGGIGWDLKLLMNRVEKGEVERELEERYSGRFGY